ncbi:tetratricopeptide repeat protein [Flavobacterium soli]|uniref:tetratricopeptide repeat protein n=1 Tax=Flavobacterium soli TaxID=344881 RepID=UPI000419A984|nr:hypothetical protein [Flavobacterium soli]
MKKPIFYIFTFIYLGILFFLITALQSCKNEKTKVVYTKKHEIINYGNTGIKDKKAAELFNEGLKNVENRDFYTAEEFFQKADAIEKDNTVILNSIALMSEKFSNYEEAELTYNRIFSNDTLSIITYINYGRFLVAQQKFEQGNQILLKGYQIAQHLNNSIDPLLLFNLSISYFYMKDCENAIKFIKLAKANAADEIFRKQIEEFLFEMTTICR